MNFEAIRDRYGHDELSDEFIVHCKDFYVFPREKTLYRLVRKDGELLKFVVGVKELRTDPIAEDELELHTLGEMLTEDGECSPTSEDGD